MKLYNADTAPVGLLNGKHEKITQRQLRKNLKRSLFSGRVKFLLWQLQATGMQKKNILSQNTGQSLGTSRYAQDTKFI